MNDEYDGKPDWWYPTRYYKGVQKVYKLMKKSSPMGTCLYYVSEMGELPYNTHQVLPHRMCWRKKKNG